jgi:hypothetical protein
MRGDKAGVEAEYRARI